VRQVGYYEEKVVHVRTTKAHCASPAALIRTVGSRWRPEVN